MDTTDTRHTLPPLTKPVFVESYDLLVRDLDTVTHYYHQIIGLDVQEQAQNKTVLGAGGKTLLTLHQDKKARPAPKEAAGLFHTAFLLPTREDLAHYLKRAIKEGIAIDGASNHLVSEALYLNDPEGNGIEIYADRPPEEWPYNQDGIVMETLPLNIEDLLSIAPDKPWTKLPADTAIGHIHLQVGSIPQADKFYEDVLGLELMTRYPGGSFFASGGYHHHLAANIWNSRGATPRRDGMSGLQGYTLGVNDKAMENITGVLDKMEIPTENTASGKRIYDPWGIAITLHRI